MEKRTAITSLQQGLTQLSLVEHALCPIDARASLQFGLIHSSSYRFTDATGERKTARARVAAPLGLSPTDEFNLWGLLALTFAQREPSPDFWATPHYCLRQLGVIAPGSKGGKSYRRFRDSLGRLASVRYENEAFYDPLRQEHRHVGFGLLGYSLPLDEQSSRAWRIVWDAQFFEFCQATGGRLRFDLALYRRLDPASRRLLLLLQKVFYRRRRSPRFRLQQLAVETLGFAADLPPNKLRIKVERAAGTLLAEGVIAKPAQFSGRGRQALVEFRRGPLMDRQRRAPSGVASPLDDTLKAIGLEHTAVHRVKRRFSEESLRLWCDVTLAAMEHKPPDFFRRSPPAFLVDNLKAASEGRRTPPDWFHELRKQESLGSPESGPPRPPADLSRALSRDTDAAKIVSELVSGVVASDSKLVAK